MISLLRARLAEFHDVAPTRVGIVELRGFWLAHLAEPRGIVDAQSCCVEITDPNRVLVSHSQISPCFKEPARWVVANRKVVHFVVSASVGIDERLCQ